MAFWKTLKKVGALLSKKIRININIRYSQNEGAYF
jgi:hypothetical protein